MKNKIFFLTLMILSVCLTSCSYGHKMKVSEVNDECRKLPLLVPGDKRAGSRKMGVILEGYLIEAKKGSSNDLDIVIKDDLNSQNQVGITFKSGSHSYQFQSVGENPTIKTGDGKDVKPNDQIRVTAEAWYLYGSCNLDGKTLEKL